LAPTVRALLDVLPPPGDGDSASLRPDLRLWVEKTRVEAMQPTVGVVASYTWAAAISRVHDSARWDRLAHRFGPKHELRAGGEGNDLKRWHSLIAAQVVHAMQLDFVAGRPGHEAMLRTWTSQAPDSTAFKLAHMCIVNTMLEPDEYANLLTTRQLA